MKTGKMTYEKPTVQKVEFDFKTRIAASGCAYVESFGTCGANPETD